jgi:hypothetical protein
MGHETSPPPPKPPEITMGQISKWADRMGWAYQMGYIPPPPPPPGWREAHLKIKCAYCGCIREHARCESCGASNAGPPKPRKLIGRLIREGTIGECQVCGSTLHRKYLFFKTDKCIHPECTNKHPDIVDYKPKVAWVPVKPNKIVTE